MPTDFEHILTQNVADLKRILPEVLVTLGFLLGLLMDCVVSGERRKTTGYICLLGVLMGLWVNVGEMTAYVQHSRQPYTIRRVVRGERPGSPVVSRTFPKDAPIATSTPLFQGMVVRDSFGTFFKFILLLGTAISLLTALNARELSGKNQGEFFLLLVATCLGGMFLCSALNLLMLYLSLETLSVLSYALAGYRRGDRKSAEAGIKYVIYGAMASGIMIFGMSYLYGLSGSLDLPRIVAHFQGLEAEAWATASHRGALLAVLAMFFSGLLYKIAAVPFHYWTPDVYEGAPTVATGFFSVVPKAAGFAVLIRVLAAFFPFGDAAAPGWTYQHAEVILAVLAFLTMTLGNLAALGQSNAKRMLAYSSIAHAGYMLAGLSVLEIDAGPGYGGGLSASGPAAVLFYLVVYLLMNLGAFLVLVALENIYGSCELQDLRGAIRREPLLSAALVIFLFSLIGVPPLAGFTGKYLIMTKLAGQQQWFMIIWIGINSLVSIFYYMRLAKAVAVDAPATARALGEQNPFVYRFLALAQVAGLLLLFIYAGPFLALCQQVIYPLLKVL